MTNWKTDVLSRYPARFEQLNDTQWIQRENIVQKEDDLQGTYFECQSRIISEEQYAAIISTQQLPEDNSHIKEALVDIYLMLLS